MPASGAHAPGESAPTHAHTPSADHHTPVPQTPLETHRRHERYKTELCRTYLESGECSYGAKCQFAHGHRELRAVLRHPLYKTKLCRNYVMLGHCPYGNRCRFVHGAEERRQEPGVRRAPSPEAISSPWAAAQSPHLHVPFLHSGSLPVPPFSLSSHAGVHVQQVPEFGSVANSWGPLPKQWSRNPEPETRCSSLSVVPKLGALREAVYGVQDEFQDAAFQAEHPSQSSVSLTSGRVHPFQPAFASRSTVYSNITSADYAASQALGNEDWTGGPAWPTWGPPYALTQAHAVCKSISYADFRSEAPASGAGGRGIVSSREDETRVSRFDRLFSRSAAVDDSQTVPAVLSALPAHMQKQESSHAVVDDVKKTAGLRPGVHDENMTYSTSHVEDMASGEISLDFAPDIRDVLPVSPYHDKLLSPFMQREADDQVFRDISGCITGPPEWGSEMSSVDNGSDGFGWRSSGFSATESLSSREQLAAALIRQNLAPTPRAADDLAGGIRKDQE